MAAQFNISSQNLIEGAEIANGVVGVIADPTKQDAIDPGKLCGVIVALIMSAARLLKDNERNVGAELGRVAIELATAQAGTEGKLDVVYNCVTCDKRIPKFARMQSKKYCGGDRCENPEHKPS